MNAPADSSLPVDINAEAARRGRRRGRATTSPQAGRGAGRIERGRRRSAGERCAGSGARNTARRDGDLQAAPGERAGACRCGRAPGARRRSASHNDAGGSGDAHGRRARARRRNRRDRRRGDRGDRPDGDERARAMPLPPNFEGPLPRHLQPAAPVEANEVFAQVLSGEFDDQVAEEPEAEAESRASASSRPSPMRRSCTRCWRKPASVRAATWKRRSRTAA